MNADDGNVESCLFWIMCKFFHHSSVLIKKLVFFGVSPPFIQKLCDVSRKFLPHPQADTLESVKKTQD
jgi:hypothetical protein